MKMPSTTLKVCFVLSLVVRAMASTVLKADSPYEQYVHGEPDRSPPERPEELNSSTAAEYGISYEEQRLAVSLMATRGYEYNVNDEFIAECTATSVDETADDQFHVELWCEGDIDDSKRVLQPAPSTYQVTYRVTPNETEQLEIRDYPLSERKTLDTATPRPEESQR